MYRRTIRKERRGKKQEKGRDERKVSEKAFQKRENDDWKPKGTMTMLQE
jgi:hypothetical protein